MVAQVIFCVRDKDIENDRRPTFTQVDIGLQTLLNRDFGHFQRPPRANIVTINMPASGYRRTVKTAAQASRSHR